MNTMTLKRMGVVAVLLVASGLLYIGCASTPPDPNNGVSPANQRRALLRISSDSALIKTKLTKGKVDDLASPHPVHTAEWWDSLIGLQDEEQKLADEALGTTPTAVPTPTPSIPFPAYTQ